ncbi:MFS-type transporter SLC18B1-like [Galendromus occidentalis]|uniref:MFS-type transporter SLC18B1-like n=1 Tax=Galendromus occidentalis TaxID=34638 RepID=A0AAJ6QTA1_9ACAR|nr:MFS-type transporter SLC18B1-like [Galendromus occidentalis]
MTPTIDTAAGAPTATRGVESRRALLVVAFIGFGLLLQSANYSHLTSFFNVYALEEKKLSSTQYGIIMGSYNFVMVFVSPLAAKLVSLRLVNDKSLLLAAWTIDALFCLMMSAVYKLRPGRPFFCGSLIIRILEASACSIGFVMPYVFSGSELNGMSHIMVPVLDTVYGWAVVAGPVMSGLLFDIGGFPLPFWVLGTALLVWTFLAVCFLPEPRKRRTEAPRSRSLWFVLNFTVIVDVLCTMSVHLLITFNESTLAQHLNVKFGYDATQSGLLFFAVGGAHAVTSLISGFLSKKMPDPRYFVFGGQMVMLAALVLQGPLISIKQTEMTLVLAQILLGVGAGPAFGCCYLHALRFLSDWGEKKDTHAALAAIFVPAFAISGVIGPIASNIALDYSSYETTVAIGALQAAAATILLLGTICLGPRSFQKSADV